MRILRTTLIFIAVIVIHGCTKPYKPPIIEPADSAFLGFHPSSIDVNETNLVMIHGMCHQDNEWVEKSSSRLADHFGMVKQETELLFKDNSSNVQVFKTIIGNDNYSINLYGIVYGPSTLPFKRFLCKDVSKESDICPTISYTRVRASLNSKLKDNLLNNCLADAIIYLGDLGNIIRKGVKNSLLSIITDIENSNSPVYILSESLGSKIIRDSLICDFDSKSAEGLNFISRSVVVFLGANQIPILNIANMNTCSVSNEINEIFDEENMKLEGGFLDIIKMIQLSLKYNKFNLTNAKQRFTVVSFTDPNDLLSYEISSEYGDNEIINVIVSNANTWFGFIENPISAHSAYRENPDILELLKCGRNNQNVQECLSK